MANSYRWDHDLIFELVEPLSSVLDLGCGNGELLARLAAEKGISGQGVEADPEKVAQAVTAGVPVYQADLDLGLAEFKDKSYDYVVLEKTLQTLHRPLVVLSEMLRIGRRCIVTFPNFAHRAVMENLVERQRMPVTRALPYKWYETPNIHLCTLYDFLDWVEEHAVTVIKGYTWAEGRRRPLALPEDGTLAEELLFLLKK